MRHTSKGILSKGILLVIALLPPASIPAAARPSGRVTKTALDAVADAGSASSPRRATSCPADAVAAVQPTGISGSGFFLVGFRCARPVPESAALRSPLSARPASPSQEDGVQEKE